MTDTLLLSQVQEALGPSMAVPLASRRVALALQEMGLDASGQEKYR